MLAGEFPISMVVLIADHAVLFIPLIPVVCHDVYYPNRFRKCNPYIASIPKVVPEAGHNSQSQLMVQILIIHSKTRKRNCQEVSDDAVTKRLKNPIERDTTPDDRAAHNMIAETPSHLVFP